MFGQLNFRLMKRAPTPRSSAVNAGNAAAPSPSSASASSSTLDFFFFFFALREAPSSSSPFSRF
jgi:hypothetical protein